MRQRALSCLYSGRSSPSPTLNPANSSSPFPVTPSMARRMKKPIMAALLFIRSALSTNPNMGFFNDGCLGGMVTPFGGVDLVAQTTAAFLLPFDSFHCFATVFPVLLALELLDRQAFGRASRGRVPCQFVFLLVLVPTLHQPIQTLRTHLHLLLARLGRETHAHVASIFFRRLDRRALCARLMRVPRRVVNRVDEGVSAPSKVRLLLCLGGRGCRCICVSGTCN